MHYIAIQNTYDIFQVALFKNHQLVDTIQEDKRHTSSLLLCSLEKLLKRNGTSLHAISFCAVNCGPGPFSTLRSVLATINGLHLATHIPLICIDGLKATFDELYDQSYDYTVVLLNAFSNEVYYLLAEGNTIIASGYKEINSLLANIASRTQDKKINFIGNGAVLHQQSIEDLFKNMTLQQSSMCSIAQIGSIGLKMFEANNYSLGYLKPLYLKKHAVEK